MVTGGQWTFSCQTILSLQMGSGHGEAPVVPDFWGCGT